MIDDVIKSVIQINGDISESGNPNPNLYPRELYITKDGKLLIGDPLSSKQDEPGQSRCEITVDKAINSTGVQYEPQGTNYKLNTDNIPTMQGFWIKDLVCSGQSGTTILTVENDDPNPDPYPNKIDVLYGRALRVYLGSFGRVDGGTIKNSRLDNTVVNLKSTQYGSTLPTNVNNYKPGDIFILIQGS